MHLRRAAAIALGLILLAQLLPAIDGFDFQEPTTYGWEMTLMSFQSLGAVATGEYPVVPAGGGAEDLYPAALALSGATANVLMLLAIICGFRCGTVLPLICACSATASAITSILLIKVCWDPFLPRIGCWMWIGAMVWLGAAAAASIFRPGDRHDNEISKPAA